MKALPLIAALAALSLTACQKQEQKQEQPKASEAAAPESRPGLSLESGRLILPAVKGNPGAAYFVLNNRSGANLVVAAISIDGTGKSEVHQTTSDSMIPVDRVEISAGTKLTFEPGKLHVMVFDINAKLAAGGTTGMTITFADGDKISAPLKIEAAGAAEAMGGTDHGDMH